MKPMKISHAILTFTEKTVNRLRVKLKINLNDEQT